MSIYRFEVLSNRTKDHNFRNTIELKIPMLIITYWMWSSLFYIFVAVECCLLKVFMTLTFHSSRGSFAGISLLVLVLLFFSSDPLANYPSSSSCNWEGGSLCPSFCQNGKKFPWKIDRLEVPEHEILLLKKKFPSSSKLSNFWIDLLLIPEMECFAGKVQLHKYTNGQLVNLSQT